MILARIAQLVPRVSELFQLVINISLSRFLILDYSLLFALRFLIILQLINIPLYLLLLPYVSIKLIVSS